MWSSRSFRRTRLVIVAVGLLAPALVAQQRRELVSWMLVDAATDARILRGWICWSPLSAGASGLHEFTCTYSDTLGYVADSVAAGRIIVTASCDHLRGSSSREKEDTVSIRGPQHFRVRMDARGCDQRPFRNVRGTFRGIYGFGFERRDFSWCADTAKRIWVNVREDREQDAIRSAAVWREHRSVFLVMPSGRPDTRVETWQEVFLEVQGTLIGPGTYGHLGGAKYLLVIDSVISATAPASGQCASK
jgi:hypothetical protein